MEDAWEVQRRMLAELESLERHTGDYDLRKQVRAFLARWRFQGVSREVVGAPKEAGGAP